MGSAYSGNGLGVLLVWGNGSGDVSEKSPSKDPYLHMEGRCRITEGGWKEEGVSRKLSHVRLLTNGVMKILYFYYVYQTLEIMFIFFNYNFRIVYAETKVPRY